MSDATQNPEKSDLPTRFATAVLLTAVAGMAVYLSGWPFRMLAAAAACMMLLEWSDMRRVGRIWTWLGIVLMVGGLIFASELPFPAMANNLFDVNYDLLAPAPQGLAIMAALGLLLGLLSRRISLGWGFIYIGVPAYALIVVNWALWHLSLWILLVTWAADIFAYFAGRTNGGPKLAPRISPKKTWAGLAGGMVGAAIVGAVAGQLLEIDPVFHYLGAPLGLLAVLGDLYESAVKRRCGVKDSGTILPGHGGILDRLDGLLPVALATFAVLVGLATGHL
ncbi:phosphatidate cytidylyltransferase [Allosphingosinicella sp.]|jgi:phosphatidate cytidylyltransferase|uniref:phosphatidate cytidylyltransferase n=1 Tax=Allosphingosinicella sp. TaxID=2823234 RepID=UPI002F09A2DF